MKTTSALLLLALFTAPPTHAADDGWISLFDGKSLDGWKASENQGSFSVVDGILVAHGKRSHLFYEGPVENHNFTDFEFEAEVMTMPGANSGVYFHTEYQQEGWPAKGYEVQVNNSHSDWRKTAGLYAILDNKEPFPDNEWFTLYIKVDGRHVTTKVNGKVVSDYTEPENVKREEQYAGRILSNGTIAIQGHDPGSEVHFRNIRIRPLK